MRSSRDALGAVVRLTAGGKTMTRQVEAGSGYASESMRPLHFGLGGADHVDAIEITWPGGFVQRLEGRSLAAVGVNRLMTIEEGSDPSGLVALARTPTRLAGVASVSRAGGNGGTH